MLVLLVLVVLVGIVISPCGALVIPTGRAVAWRFFLLAGGGALGLRGRVQAGASILVRVCCRPRRRGGIVSRLDGRIILAEELRCVSWTIRPEELLRSYIHRLLSYTPAEQVPSEVP